MSFLGVVINSIDMILVINEMKTQVVVLKSRLFQNMVNQPLDSFPY